ncbi:MAG: class B sortase [Acetanaerobacterium sp.]
MRFKPHKTPCMALALCIAIVLLCSCSMFYTPAVPSDASSEASEAQPLFVSAPPEEAKIPDNSFIPAVEKAADKNHDTVGWLYIPGSDVDNSVLQSFDNSYYIRRNEQRTDDIYGCYFVDYDASVDEAAGLARNIIIYGHSDLTDNPDGKRFSQLFKFTGEDFAQATPNIYFSTNTDDMVWRVFAVLYANKSFSYILPNPSDTQYERIIEKARGGSLYDYDVEVTGDDHILTLSTCSVKHGTGGNYRFVVMARLLREGESFDDILAAPIPNPDNALVE